MGIHCLRNVPFQEGEFAGNPLIRVNAFSDMAGVLHLLSSRISGSGVSCILRVGYAVVGSSMKSFPSCG